MTLWGFRRFARGGIVAGLWSRRRAVCVEAPEGRGGSVGANGRVEGRCYRRCRVPRESACRILRRAGQVGL